MLPQSRCCDGQLWQQDAAPGRHPHQRRQRRGRATARLLSVALLLAGWRTAHGADVNASDPTLFIIDPSFTDGSQKVPTSYLGLSLEPINQTGYYAGDDVRSCCDEKGGKAATRQQERSAANQRA